MNIAVVFAGGAGIRMGAGLSKQFIEINGRPVLAHTLDLFQRHPAIDGIYLVCNPAFRDRTEELVKRFSLSKVCRLVDGGATAQDSIYAGLQAVAADYPPETIVLLHNGIRSYIEMALIECNSESVRRVIRTQAVFMVNDEYSSRLLPPFHTLLTSSSSSARRAA